MTSAIIIIAVLIAATTFLATTGIWRIIQALRARERTIVRAEDLGATSVVQADPLRRRSLLVRWADRYNRSPAAIQDRTRLRRAYLAWSPADYRVIRLAVGLISGYIGWIFLGLPLLLAVVLGGTAYVSMPRLLLAMRRDAYVQAFDAQLVEVTQLLANALRAGLAVQQALGQIAERLPDPSGAEFRQTYHELLLGNSLTHSLTALRNRVASRDLDILVTTIVVQHQAGGNLARIFAAMANILTERQRLAREVDVLTAEARFSALVVMLMPIALVVLLRGSPIGEALFGHPAGWLLLAMFGATQVGLYFLIQRIARITV